jgi:ABC-type branched-subunit amino acid transport system ATPase component
MALWDTMTVAENVALGWECGLAGRAWHHQLWGTRRERAACLDVAADAIERCSISHVATATVGELSTGQRRLVELARAIACRFRVLLLDEPASGLDERESRAFASVLIDLVERDGTGILLVEHDMSLVRATCSYCYVLDFGRLIFQGPTEETLRSDAVRAAYLGSETSSGVRP